MSVSMQCGKGRAVVVALFFVVSGCNIVETIGYMEGTLSADMIATTVAY